MIHFQNTGWCLCLYIVLIITMSGMLVCFFQEGKNKRVFNFICDLPFVAQYFGGFFGHTEIVFLRLYLKNMLRIAIYKALILEGLSLGAVSSSFSINLPCDDQPLTSKAEPYYIKVQIHYL